MSSNQTDSFDSVAEPDFSDSKSPDPEAAVSDSEETSEPEPDASELEDSGAVEPEPDVYNVLQAYECDLSTGIILIIGVVFPSFILGIRC